MQQSELPAGRNFEDRPALRIRLSFLAHFACAVKVSVRGLDDVVGAPAAWTILELRNAKARESIELRRLRVGRECAGYQQKQGEDQSVGFHGYFLSVGEFR